ILAEQGLGGAHDEPQRVQPITLGAAPGLRQQRDEPLLAYGHGGAHATRRSTAAATSAGEMSTRQRWCPIGQRAEPMAEQGRQSSARCSTVARALYGKNPNCSTVGPNRATTGVPTPVAMCITPVSFDTSTRARASKAPVSWSENSPAAVTACPASLPPRPRSSGPPSTTAVIPVARSR